MRLEKKDDRHPVEKLDFEAIFKQNERRIYYHMQRLGIRDEHNIFFTEGLYAMWLAYKNYQPDKGPLATYFNYSIRNRLIDMLRKNERETEKDEAIAEAKKQEISERVRGEALGLSAEEKLHKEVERAECFQKVRSELTEKQWKWVYYSIIQGMPVKEIAELEGVSVEAVKSWGKGARAKLRKRM
jgi:RNA polymerase sigma factor (sigma-70 family)